MTIPQEPAFALEEYRRRLDAVQAAMADAALDGLLLFGPANIYYLSGMDSENLFDFQCLVVPASGDPELLIFELEAGRAANSCWVPGVHLYTAFSDPVAETVALARRLGLARGRLGIEEGAGLTPGQHERLGAALATARLSDAFGVVETVRLRKSAPELALMGRAAALTDAAVEAGFAASRTGVHDREVAAAICASLYRGGSDVLCWGPIVATGYRAGIAHSTFNGRKLEHGDAIFLELTGQTGRYTAPLMRSAVLGAPDAEMRMVARAAADAIAAIVATARPGISARQVAAAGAEALAPVLDLVVFHHYYGYPVGIGYPGTWIERLGMFLRADDDTLLEQGMVFHLPISLRKYGEWGVNLSHTLVITDSGAQPLTRSPARLEVLDGGG